MASGLRNAIVLFQKLFDFVGVYNSEIMLFGLKAGFNLSYSSHSRLLRIENIYVFWR